MEKENNGHPKYVYAQIDQPVPGNLLAYVLSHFENHDWEVRQVVFAGMASQNRVISKEMPGFPIYLVIIRKDWPLDQIDPPKPPALKI